MAGIFYQILLEEYHFHYQQLLFLLCHLSGQAQNKNFTIEGKIDAATISKLFFVEGNFQGQPNNKAKEVKVEKGKFTITGSFKEPIPAFLSLTEDLKGGSDDAVQFILDEGKIKIEIKGHLKTAKISGSAANDGFQKFQKGQSRFEEQFSKLNKEAQAAAQSGVPMDSLQRKYEPIFNAVQKEMTDYKMSFIRENSNTYISLLLVSDVARTTQNYIQADSLWNLLDYKIKDGAIAKQIKAFLTSQKKTSLGAQAPDFSLADTSSKKLSLSSLKGKYVLIDFWASWCKPCRDENPNVVQAYQSFKDKGFTVLGVSLDRDRKSWLNAIKADQLAWNHVSDLKFWSSEAAVLYGITAIPRNFLLDPQGKIIARDLRGPALLEKLKELLK